jgi:redox-sensitive bicupin YhaK (pirin superfamily)
MAYLRYGKDRGFNDLGWLQSHHSFSFSGYHDPDHMGFSALRVINDDRVRPGAGFPRHSHQDMEIISYVKQGAIEHKDSMGNIKVLPAGEFQLMSAGTGVSHSEYNPSTDDHLSFLQIWIVPDTQGVEPCYQQKHFGHNPGLTLIASPDGRDGSLRIHQDARLHHLLLEPGQRLEHAPQTDHDVYVHVVAGHLGVNGQSLVAGDGIGLSSVDQVQFIAQDEVEAIVFDLP